jgi:2-polyprenyl-3-methyl-5-hydroxy-6-metoxy-1,4-benzoquinol methylase
MSGYAIRGGEDGRRRLDLLARIAAPTTQALLLRAGIAPRMRCFDLGCGGGHVARFTAERVGSDGAVVGVDIDEIKLDAARSACAQAGLRNVEFRHVDVSRWGESDAYDLVYGRFILSHLADCGNALARVFAALKPGGVAVFEDIDFDGSFCQPPNAAYARYCDWYRAVVARRGGNAALGRELYGLCLDAGLVDTEIEVVQLAHAGIREEKRLHASTLANIADALEAEGIATRDAIAATLAELEAFSHDPRSIIALPRVFQVWGRKAGAEAGARVEDAAVAASR